MQGVQRYVIFAYLVIGGALSALLGRVFVSIFSLAGWNDAPLLGSRFSVTTLMGLVVGVAATLFAYNHPKARDFSSDVVGELKKVTWPTKKDVQTMTVVVTITTLVLAAVMGVFDQAWGTATSIIYK